MPPSSSKRWIEILRLVRADLPGTWTLRGRALKTTLIREPIGWAIPWIGGSKASAMRLHAGVMPAVERALSRRMGLFGFDMADVKRGPRAIDLGTEGDLEVAQAFVGNALARIDELTPEFYAYWAERDLEVMSGITTKPASIHVLPSLYICGAPGWRIVNDSGDPVEAAQECIRFYEYRFNEPDTRNEAITFYRELIDIWHNGGRTASLAWLTERRDRQLAELGYGDNAIVD